MKLLITGAGGFLGQVMVEVALSAGYEVRAWARSVPNDATQLWLSSEHYLSDLDDFTAHAAALKDVNVVINCAAVTSAGRTDLQRSLKTNVEAMRNLLRLAAEAGVARWIQISSMSAHEGSTSVYGKTKLAGDELLRASNPPPNWTILRPSLIYGPGERGLVGKTLALMKKLPVMPIIGGGRERIRPIYVRDVASAAIGVIEKKSTYDKTYMVGGDDEIELHEFLRKMLAEYKLRRPFLPLPVPVAMALARGLALVTPHPPISVDNVLGVREAQRVDIADAVRDFGFAPMGVEAGLKQAHAASK